MVSNDRMINNTSLVVNKLFIRDLMQAAAPCFALGYVEVEGLKTGFIALRPETSIPRTSTDQGFRLGHSVLGVEGKPVLHFCFEFYGHATFHGLVPPNNPIAREVISSMLETEEYFFFAINPDQTVTAFRAGFGDPAGLRKNREEFGDKSCSLEQYEKMVKSFTKNPKPQGQVMEWVCRDNPDYLDLVQYPLELTPRA